MILKDKLLCISGAKIFADTTAKLRSSLHMIEGGTMKATTLIPVATAVKVEKEKLDDVYLYHNYLTSTSISRK